MLFSLFYFSFLFFRRCVVLILLLFRLIAMGDFDVSYPFALRGSACCFLDSECLLLALNDGNLFVMDCLLLMMTFIHQIAFC